MIRECCNTLIINNRPSCAEFLKVNTDQDTFTAHKRGSPHTSGTMLWIRGALTPGGHIFPPS